MTQSRLYLSVAFLVVCAAVIFVYLNQAHKDKALAPAVYDATKQIRYSFEIRNTGSDFIADSTFAAFAPVAVTSSQNVLDIDASHAFVIEADELGNQLMRFQLKAIPPYGKKVVVVTVKLGVAHRPNQIAVASEYFLADHEGLQISHPEVVATANRLAGLSGDLGEEVFSWVASHVSYGGFDPEDRGALYALQNARGDCTEYSHLTTALLRASGVPARVMGGFVLESGENVLRAADYHNWTELLEDQRWKLSDSQKGTFDKNYENYIAFRVIEPGATMMSNSHRFLAFDRRLEVMMN